MQYQNYIRGTVAKQISANQISFVTLNAFFFYKSMCKIRVYIKLFTSMNVKSNFQKKCANQSFFFYVGSKVFEESKGSAKCVTYNL